MKKIEVNGYWVEVTPRTFLRGTQRIAEERDACESIKQEIRRHVDSVASIRVMSDTTPVCSYCGCKWTEDNDTYNGGCCDQDIADHDAAGEQDETE